MEINNNNIIECERDLSKAARMVSSVEQWQRIRNIIYNRYNLFNRDEFEELFEY